MAMAKGAFRLNTFMVGQGYRSDYSMGKATTHFIKGNVMVERKVVCGRTMVTVFKGREKLEVFDISGGPQKATVVANLKEFIAKLA